MLLLSPISAKFLFPNYFSRDIEGFKNQQAIELEKLKSDLKRTAYEHEVRFSRLHEKRAKVIAELYDLLYETSIAQERVVLRGGPNATQNHDQTENEQALLEIGNRLHRYFNRNGIYLTPQLCERIAAFNQRLMTIFGQYLLAGHESLSHGEPGKCFR